jgi:hypothetical protein
LHHAHATPIFSPLYFPYPSHVMSRLAAVLQAEWIPNDIESVAVKQAKVRSLHAYMVKIIDAATQDEAESSPFEQGGEDLSVAWKAAHEAIFTDEIFVCCIQLLRDIESEWEYYDPDTTYQHDTCAFVTAVGETVRSW